MGLFDKFAEYAAKKIEDYVKDQDKLEEDEQQKEKDPSKDKKKEWTLEDLIKFLLQLFRLQEFQEMSMGYRGFSGSSGGPEQLPKSEEISQFVSEHKGLCETAHKVATKALDFAEKMVDKYCPEAFKKASKDSIKASREFLKDCGEVLKDPSKLENIDKAKKSMLEARDTIQQSFEEAHKAQAQSRGQIKARVEGLPQHEPDRGTPQALDSQRSVAAGVTGGATPKMNADGSIDVGKGVSVDRSGAIVGSDPKPVIDAAKKAGGEKSSISVECPASRAPAVSAVAEGAGVSVSLKATPKPGAAGKEESKPTAPEPAPAPAAAPSTPRMGMGGGS